MLYHIISCWHWSTMKGEICLLYSTTQFMILIKIWRYVLLYINWHHYMTWFFFLPLMSLLNWSFWLSYPVYNTYLTKRSFSYLTMALEPDQVLSSLCHILLSIPWPSSPANVISFHNNLTWVSTTKLFYYLFKLFIILYIDLEFFVYLIHLHC